MDEFLHEQFVYSPKFQDMNYIIAAEISTLKLRVRPQSYAHPLPNYQASFPEVAVNGKPETNDGKGSGKCGLLSQYGKLKKGQIKTPADDKPKASNK